jgi:hypothetical protein
MEQRIMATRRKIHKETIYMFEQKVKHVIEKKHGSAISEHNFA